jgi:hypothetical protein
LRGDFLSLVEELDHGHLLSEESLQVFNVAQAKQIVHEIAQFDSLLYGLEKDVLELLKVCDAERLLEPRACAGSERPLAVPSMPSGHQ